MSMFILVYARSAQMVRFRALTRGSVSVPFVTPHMQKLNREFGCGTE